MRLTVIALTAIALTAITLTAIATADAMDIALSKLLF